MTRISHNALALFAALFMTAAIFSQTVTVPPQSASDAVSGPTLGLVIAA